MKTLFLLFAAAALSLAAESKTFTGVITDAMCGKDHAMMNVKPDAKCVAECIKMGSKYALIDGDNVYELSGKIPPTLAAKKVTVTGTLKDKTIEVQSVAAAK
jgi:hypothetical protein